MADRFRRGPKRRTHWTELAGASNIVSSGSTLLASQAAGHEGETLVRTRGLFMATLLTASAAGDGFFGAIGIAKVTTAAATAGVGSMPTPITEAGWDGWLLHRYFGVAQALVNQGGGAIHRLELDSKAMRKVNDDESIVMIAEFIETGTASVDVTGRVRILSMVG